MNAPMIIVAVVVILLIKNLFIRSKKQIEANNTLILICFDKIILLTFNLLLSMSCSFNSL